jgi:hypothetical protein
MKVRFLTVMGGKDVLYIPEEVYDLPNPQAKRFIEHGVCVEENENVEKEIKVRKTVIGKTSKVTKKKAKK